MMARCAWCGAEFEQHHGMQRFCCERCRREHRKAAQRRRYATDPDYKLRVLMRSARWRDAQRRHMDPDELARACAAALDGDARLMAMMMCGATLKQLEREWLGGD